MSCHGMVMLCNSTKGLDADTGNVQACIVLAQKLERSAANPSHDQSSCIFVQSMLRKVLSQLFRSRIMLKNSAAGLAPRSCNELPHFARFCSGIFHLFSVSLQQEKRCNRSLALVVCSSNSGNTSVGIEKTFPTKKSSCCFLRGCGCC